MLVARHTDAVQHPDIQLAGDNRRNEAEEEMRAAVFKAPGDVGVGELLACPVHHEAQLAGVDEESVFAAVAETAFGVGGFVFREDPEADGDLRAVEELAGEGDHAVHEVGLDEGAADVAFAGLVGGHAAIGEDEAGHALRREVVDEVLHPGRGSLKDE